MSSLRPDLIVTQALCPVCAVSHEEVSAIAKDLPSRPEVISLDPHTLGESLGDVRTIAEATGRRDEGVALVARSAGRVDTVRLAVRRAERPRVVALEWLDPVFIAGHWTPQLIELAGGEDMLGLPAEPSQQLDWQTVAAADAPRAREEAYACADRLRALGPTRVVAVDGAAHFSRPGPRLVDGLELLAHILHPDCVDPAAGQALEVELF